jgi:hypothetical protein
MFNRKKHSKFNYNHVYHYEFLNHNDDFNKIRFTSLTIYTVYLTDNKSIFF